ncbi:MAG: hypothetical protein H6712_24405 [Myxococcales bacterium]|nr:hypothetical protein [Myxococcales bacterium]
MVGLTHTDPVQAVREMSDAIRVGIKDVRAISEDGYQYGIPVADRVATFVRARLLPVTEVASMVTSTMT